MHKFKKLLLPTILVIAATASAQHTSGNIQKGSADDESAVRTTLQQLYAAWSDLNPSKAARFYAKDADLVFFDVAPLKYNGWSEYATGVPTAFAPFSSGKFTL